MVLGITPQINDYIIMSLDSFKIYCKGSTRKKGGQDYIHENDKVKEKMKREVIEIVSGRESYHLGVAGDWRQHKRNLLDSSRKIVHNDNIKYQKGT